MGPILVQRLCAPELTGCPQKRTRPARSNNQTLLTFLRIAPNDQVEKEPRYVHVFEPIRAESWQMTDGEYKYMAHNLAHPTVRRRLRGHGVA